MTSSSPPPGRILPESANLRGVLVLGKLTGLFRLTKGKNTCFGLFFEKMLVGINWLGYEEGIDSLEFARILRGYTECAVLHHVYILPDHRGKELQQPMMLAGKYAAKRLGRTTIFTFVGVLNFASSRNMMKCSDGYQLISHVKIDLPLHTFDFFPASDIFTWHACETNNQN